MKEEEEEEEEEEEKEEERKKERKIKEQEAETKEIIQLLSWHSIWKWGYNTLQNPQALNRASPQKKIRLTLRGDIGWLSWFLCSLM